MTIILSARWVLPVTAAPIENGAVAVTGGQLSFVGKKDECVAAFPHAVIRDFGHAAILPGLVNTHSHLELTCFRGRLETGDFFSWISTLVRLKRERLSSDDVLASSLLGCTEAVRNGITTTGDTSDSSVVVEAIVTSGLRGVIFQEFFGPDTSQAGESIEGLRRKLDEHRAKISASNATDRIRVGISPHAPYSVSSALYRKAAKLALADKLEMAIHTAESQDEVALLRDGSGAFGAMLKARGIGFTPPGVSTIRYFQELGVMEAKPLLIHCVTVDERDLELISGAGARIAHCPKSNAKFGHGIAPYLSMKRHGISVGLGTDSAASNNRLDLLEEVRFGAYIHRAAQRNGHLLPARELLQLITIDAARALGLDSEIGSLEMGKQADLAVLSLTSAAPSHDVEAAIAFAGQGQDIMFTMAAGEILYDNGSFPRLDIEKLSWSADQSIIKLRE